MQTPSEAQLRDHPNHRLARPEFVKLPALLLAGAAATVKAGRLWCGFGFRGHIKVKRLGLWGGAAPGSKISDLDHPDFAHLRKCQGIADTDGNRAFGNLDGIDPHLPGNDLFRT